MMNDNWQKPTHSKNRIRKVANQLVENDLSFEERFKCLSILANFRSSHEYPMQSMIGYFRKKAFAVDKKAIVVRRLKRIPSIISKLKRFPTMQVTTMGDMGGIRIITKDLKSVRKIKAGIISGRTRNKLLNEKNYLDKPKASGYRGIHLTYRYQGAKSEFHGLRVELQIRSRIQHAWATAVEVVGTFFRENLKASQGNEDWLRFFYNPIKKSGWVG